MDDIVTRLRTVDRFSDALGVMDAAADEIERLRTAGDAVLQAIRSHDLREAHLQAWKEARRG